MPLYCIETAYHIPAYHHTVVEADSPEEACELALANDDWSDAKQDPESAGETYVAGIWTGAVPYEGDAVSVPTQFEESVIRRATHYGETLMLLIEASYIACHTWRPRVSAAIQKARAIFNRLPDPPEPTEPHPLDDTRARPYLDPTEVATTAG